MCINYENIPQILKALKSKSKPIPAPVPGYLEEYTREFHDTKRIIFHRKSLEQRAMDDAVYKLIYNMRQENMEVPLALAVSLKYNKILLIKPNELLKSPFISRVNCRFLMN